MQRLKTTSNNKNKTFNLSSTNFAIPLMTTVGLLAGGVAFLNPLSFVDNSYADSTNTDISVNIGETIMLPEVSQEAINLTLEPNVNGDFESASVNVRMSTNHVSGYTLTMSTEGTETALTSSDFDSYQIDALGSKTSATNFADLTHTDSINKWGYATDNNGDGEGQTEENYYYGITNKDNPTTIKITDGPTNSSETNVTFATKGKDLAAGTYSNVVIFSAVGNYISTPIKDGMYMQDVTTKMCADSTTWTPENNKEYTLKDSRDDLEYKIRKLADSNCWMAQNLRLTADTLISNNHSATLTSVDTNLTNSYTMPNNTPWLNETATTEGAADATKLPKGSRTGTKASGEEAIAHGAYYSWATAVANKDSIDASSKQTGSICPKGWKLPNIDGSDSSSDNNMYYRLYNDSSKGYSGNYANFMAAYNHYYGNGADYYLSGSYSPVSGYRYVIYAGSGDSWWSSTSHLSNTNDAWVLSASTNGIDPQSNGTRYVGLSIRCVLNATGT